MVSQELSKNNIVVFDEAHNIGTEGAASSPLLTESLLNTQITCASKH